ncbi:MAG: GHKL domain-containing protein [Eubacteriales bacterium]|nr:GHKL domain-containing protein [Eubacteriales bacterium]
MLRELFFIPMTLISCGAAMILLTVQPKSKKRLMLLPLTIGYVLMSWMMEPALRFTAFYIVLTTVNGSLIYLLFSRLTTIRRNGLYKMLLICTFTISSMLPIWVGDNNLQFIFPIFVVCCMIGTQGGKTGRLAVIFTFFCIEMSICTMVDSYLMRSSEYYDILTRMARPILFALLYLILRRIIPEDGIHLPESLWRILLGLSMMPLCALLSIVLLTYLPPYDSVLVDQIQNRLGIAVLPFVLLTSFVILLTMRVLANHEQLERARQLAELRESYYQSLNRQEKQIRHLRHDMRNHLMAMQGMIARGNTAQAEDYLGNLLDSQALHGGRRLCSNETANAVLCAKLDHMQQSGLEADLRVDLPEQLDIAPPDLCALLCNALDNAIEAAKDADDRRIIVRCRCDKGMLMLKVVNAFAGERNDDLRTTKPDKQLHGLGLAGMRDIVQRYGGTLDTTLSHKTFELTACLIVNQN